MIEMEYVDYIENAIQNDVELREAYEKLADVYEMEFPYEPEIAVQLKKKIRAYSRKR